MTRMLAPSTADQEPPRTSAISQGVRRHERAPCASLDRWEARAGGLDQTARETCEALASWPVPAQEQRPVGAAGRIGALITTDPPAEDPRRARCSWNHPELDRGAVCEVAVRRHYQPVGEAIGHRPCRTMLIVPGRVLAPSYPGLEQR
jgi:hypothetical protein